MKPKNVSAILSLQRLGSVVNSTKPWKNTVLSQTTGLACVVESQILTNAHLVADASLLTLRNDLGRFFAKVVHIGHECDLAILKIIGKDGDNHGFHNFRLGSLPKLGEEVSMFRSNPHCQVEKTNVANVAMIGYEHSASKLLSFQLEAKMDPGESGSPIFQKDGKVAGIAFQRDNQHRVFAVPSLIINHFLEDIRRFGFETGFPNLGILYRKNNKKILGNHSGVCISYVYPNSPAFGYLEKNDIILAVDGVCVEENGQVALHEEQKIDLPFLILQKHKGDEVDLTIERKNKKKNVKVIVEPLKYVVPIYSHDKSIPFFYFW